MAPNINSSLTTFLTTQGQGMANNAAGTLRCCR